MNDAAIAKVIAELTKRAENARDRWSLPKHPSPSREYSWHGREIGYKEAIDLLLEALKENEKVRAPSGR
jgi:sugar-specific transcriptional regulator TrmB